MAGQLLLCSLLLLFATGYAQDRSQSRYLASAHDSERDHSQQQLQARRIPPRRVRPTMAPTDESSEEDGLRRLPVRIQPHLEDSYDVRQSPFNSPTYNQPSSENYPQPSDEVAPVVQTERRKRPKRRRRPKTQPKPEPALIGTPEDASDEKSSDLSINPETKDEFYRNEEFLPSPSPHLPRRRQPQRGTSTLAAEERSNPRTDHVQREPPKSPGLDNTDRYNVRTSSRDIIEPTNRNLNRGRTDHRGSSRYNEDSSAETSTQRSGGRTFRRQNYVPQPSVNRLPVENSSDRLKSRDHNKHHSLNLSNNPTKESHSSSQSGYPAETSDKDYHGIYANVDDHGASRLPIQDGQNEDRLPHRRPELIEPNLSVLPTEQPHTGSIYDAGRGYDEALQHPEVKLPLEHTKDENRHDQETNTKYAIPSNRLPDSSELNYGPHDLTSARGVGHSSNSERNPASISSERLPPESHRRSLPYDEEDVSLARIPKIENRPRPNHPRVPIPSAGDSRYQDELPIVPIHDRSSNVQRHGNRQAIDSAEPRNQRSRSRYQSGNVAIPVDGDRQPHEPTASRDSTHSQRSRSRYQTEDLEPVRHSLERAQTSRNRLDPPSTQARSVPTRDTTRSRHQSIPTSEVINAQAPSAHGRRGPERSRSHSDPGSQTHRNRQSYSAESSIPERHSRENLLKDVSRTIEQPITDISSHPDEDSNNRNFYRSRPQHEGNAQYQDSPRTSQPRYVPEYQSVERDARPRASKPQEVEPNVPQRRPTHRRTQLTPSPKKQTQESARPSESQRPRGKSDFQCPDSFGFYPDESQCDKYYECRNGTAVEGLCSDGLAFNLISAPTYLRCDSVRDIDCSLRPNLQKPQPTKNCPRRYGLYGDEVDCTKFWHCVDGAATQVQCPPGLVYDDSKGTCNWADLVKDSCNTEELIGFKCPDAPAGTREGVYLRYPHPDNCQLHFTCIKGLDGQQRPRVLSCNDGFAFDPETSTCMREDNVPGCSPDSSQ